MIKLVLLPKPTQLTAELQQRLTTEFETTGKAVWNMKWLKEAVSNLSYGKCCYSEIRLGEESKYMEMDHFAHKDRYPDKAMEWGNLLPSCKKCNTTKRDHDTLKDPIVNPFLDDPKDYFYMRAYRYYAKNNNPKATLTIEVVALNDRSHFVTPRFRIGDKISETLSDLQSRVEDVLIAKRQRKYISQVKGLMMQGNRKEEYAALVSTVILSDDNYKLIEDFLRNNSLWDDELEDAKKELEFCALPE